MSKPFNDPSLLTKNRLKEELERNGIELPKGEQKKEVYVNLYRENLSPQSGGRLGNGDEFSSDEEGYAESPQSKQIVATSNRSIKKVGSKDIVSSAIKDMTDDELKEELTRLGQSFGPIVPTTRELYERKLARLHATSAQNGDTTTTLSKTEFSDNDFDEEPQEEQNGAEDEFFYKHSRRSGGGTAFGSTTFTKNFQNSKKEVTHDMSMSSSRNVERTSTVDRQTMNKVHTRKGDKVEERTWSSTDQNGSNAAEESTDQEDAMPALPATLQRALDSARRLSPEKSSSLPQPRERILKRSVVAEDVPKRASSKLTAEKKTKEVAPTKNKSTKRWWIIVVVILILIILTCAVVYNIEKLPELKRSFNQLTSNKKRAVPISPPK